MSLFGIDPNHPDEFKAHPPVPSIPDEPQSIELKTLTVAVNIRVGNRRLGRTRVLWVPPPGTPLDTYAALHAPAVLAELVPVLTRELAKSLEIAQSGQFQGD